MINKKENNHDKNDESDTESIFISGMSYFAFILLIICIIAFTFFGFLVLVMGWI